MPIVLSFPWQTRCLYFNLFFKNAQGALISTFPFKNDILPALIEEFFAPIKFMKRTQVKRPALFAINLLLPQ
jgi:hypothetical protein